MMRTVVEAVALASFLAAAACRGRPSDPAPPAAQATPSAATVRDQGDPLSRPEAAEPILAEGRALPPARAAELLARLQRDPADLRTRLLLIGYHGRGRGEAGPSGEPYDSLITGLIERHPRSVLAGEMGLSRESFDRGAKLWLELAQANPADAWIVGNAGSFLTSDVLNIRYRDQARALLERARELDRQNPRWSYKLALMLQVEYVGPLGKPQREAASRALAYWEEALELARAGEHQWLDPRSVHTCRGITEAAWKAGERQKARQYATELLEVAATAPRDWNTGNAIYDGNHVLGLVALEEGRPEDAKRHLLAAGRTTGSPQLNSFGPDFDLAQALLARGERDTVLEFLTLCGRFWKKPILEEWKAAIAAGRQPDFRKKWSVS